MRAREVIDTLVSFLASICLAYLALVNTDLPTTTTTTQGESSLFDTSSGTVKETGLTSSAFGSLLLRYAYIFVRWLCFMAEYVSLPLALPFGFFFNRRWVLLKARDAGKQAFEKMAR